MDNQEKTSWRAPLRKIHETFHHMVRTCSHWVPKGSGSKPCKDLARPPRMESHNLWLPQSPLTGWCYKCAYLPACPAVFTMGTATFRKEARKQSPGTLCAGKHPGRHTQLRNTVNNSIWKTEAWGLACTWSSHNPHSNSAGSKYWKGSQKVTGEKCNALPQWKHFPKF